MRYDSRTIPVQRATEADKVEVLRELKPWQNDALIPWRDWWTKVGLSTEPCDRPAFEAAVARCYMAYGFTPPKRFVWADGAISFRDAVKEHAPSENWRNFTGGAFSVGWTCYSTYLLDVGGVTFDATLTERINAFRDCHETGGFWLPTEDICFCMERPYVQTMDEAGRLHNTNGPALAYRDGWGLYYAHGINIPGYVITDPSRITIAMVEQQDNLEVKRVFIEQYGVARYLEDARWKMEHKDETGELYARPVVRTGNQEASEFSIERMVRVWNGTREGDGRIREFILPVHPELRPMKRRGTEDALGEPQEPTARAAVASTYGLRAEQYVVALRT